MYDETTTLNTLCHHKKKVNVWHCQTHLERRPRFPSYHVCRKGCTKGLCKFQSCSKPFPKIQQPGKNWWFQVNWGCVFWFRLQEVVNSITEATGIWACFPLLHTWLHTVNMCSHRQCNIMMDFILGYHLSSLESTLYGTMAGALHGSIFELRVCGARSNGLGLDATQWSVLQ